MSDLNLLKNPFILGHILASIMKIQRIEAEEFEPTHTFLLNHLLLTIIMRKKKD